MLLFVICITGQGELRFVVHVCLIISTVLNFNKCASDGIVMLTIVHACVLLPVVCQPWKLLARDLNNNDISHTDPVCISPRVVP